jgi:hypothetical protein
LHPPTSDPFANVDLYRLEGLTTSAAGVEPAWVEVTVGALAEPMGGAPLGLGLLQAIIEIYVVDDQPGFSELLPGSGLQMAAGRGWRDALRLTHEGAFGWQAVLSHVDGSLALVGMEGPIPRSVVRTGRTLRVALPAALPEGASVMAISGVHDPFSPTGWRAIAAAPSPFAFASDDPGRPAIIDLAPGDAAAYQRVVATAELGGRDTVRIRGWEVPLDLVLAWRWWLLTAIGLALFALGVAVVRRGRRSVISAFGDSSPAQQSRLLARPSRQADSLDLIGDEEIATRR